MRISDWSSDVCSSDLADGDAALAGDAIDSLCACGGEIDQALEGEPAGVQMVEQQRQQGLYPRHARGRARIGRRLLLTAVRGMVGADDVGDAEAHRLPQRLAVARVADRRVHPRQAAEPPVALGRRHDEVLTRTPPDRTWRGWGKGVAV